MANISIRESIRWLPGEASEPTSTIVLTSPSHRFVDLRITHSNKSNSAVDEDLLPLFRLDWGIAGISYSTPEVDYKGEKATHGRWTHWIDSRTQDTESAADEGWMTPLNPERTRMLERGEMENPETCEVTPYEEIWIERSPDNVPGPEKQQCQCIVLKLDEHGSAKGLIVRAGKICQGIMRVGEEIRAERWEWHEGKWLRTKRVMGDEGISVPCERVLDPETQWREQQQIEHQGRCWTAVEVSEI